MWSNCSNAAASMAQMAAQIEKEKRQKAIAAAKASRSGRDKCLKEPELVAESSERSTSSKRTLARKFFAGLKRRGIQKSTSSVWRKDSKFTKKRKVSKDVTVTDMEASSVSDSTGLSMTNIEAGTTSSTQRGHFMQYSVHAMPLESVETSRTATPSSANSSLRSGIQLQMQDDDDGEDELAGSPTNPKHEQSAKDSDAVECACPPETGKNRPLRVEIDATNGSASSTIKNMVSTQHNDGGGEMTGSLTIGNQSIMTSPTIGGGMDVPTRVQGEVFPRQKTRDQGFSLAQFLRGLLVSLACYLRTVYQSIGEALVDYSGLFLPGVFWIFGGVPVWTRIGDVKSSNNVNITAIGLVGSICILWWEPTVLHAMVIALVLAIAVLFNVTIVFLADKFVGALVRNVGGNLGKGM